MTVLLRRAGYFSKAPRNWRRVETATGPYDILTVGFSVGKYETASYTHEEQYFHQIWSSSSILELRTRTSRTDVQKGERYVYDRALW